jgi:peptidoglycan hydrolase CwlO-like protein
MILNVKKKFLFLIALLLVIPALGNYFAWAQTATPTIAPSSVDQGRLSELQNKINELQGKVSSLQGQEKSLSSEIAVMDNQIKLTEYRIEANKEQILSLEADIDTTTKKIGKLEKSLDELTKVLLNRIVATYEIGTIQPFHVLLSSTNISNFLTRLNYLRIAQVHDKRLIYETEQAKIDYANQKEIFEDKKKKIEALKKELEAYTRELEQDKIIRQDLLNATQSDEQKYQQLLAQAKAEYEAILGIVSGKGTETEVGHISEGQRIATMIPGESCNSSGPHVHFMVTKNGNTENPFSYLGQIDNKNCSGGGNCNAADPFNPSGSWGWPLDPTIIFNQGYGSTWAVANTWVGRIYSFHNGIDISSSSTTVKAVKEGILYKGSYSVGCALGYVRVSQSDGIDTYYLHVYP